MTKLYVGNLPFSATEDQVRTLFAAHGTVDKVSLVNDRETGRPRGFGFVEMPNADATRAMMAAQGRAARLGPRSIGHLDPGAASAAALLDNLAYWAETTAGRKG